MLNWLWNSIEPLRRPCPVNYAHLWGLKTVPSVEPFPQEIWGEKTCALISCYTGSKEEAEAMLRPLRDALPEPIMDGMTTMPFPEMQRMFDPLLPSGLQWYWKGDFINELPNEAIDLHMQFAKNFPTDQSIMHLYPIDGAVQEVGADETAWHHRDVTWSMVIAGISNDPAEPKRSSGGGAITGRQFTPILLVARTSTS